MVVFQMWVGWVEKTGTSGPPGLGKAGQRHVKTHLGQDIHPTGTGTSLCPSTEDESWCPAATFQYPCLCLRWSNNNKDK